MFLPLFVRAISACLTAFAPLTNMYYFVFRYQSVCFVCQNTLYTSVLKRCNVNSYYYYYGYVGKALKQVELSDKSRKLHHFTVIHQ